ncbi:MAG TPA: hypothetical protein PLP17_05590 [Oligoflexia bacterium]|nr:hypothetical protein [Oligoflexia bacterium]
MLPGTKVLKYGGREPLPLALLEALLTAVRLSSVIAARALLDYSSQDTIVQFTVSCRNCEQQWVVFLLEFALHPITLHISPIQRTTWFNGHPESVAKQTQFH